MAILLAIWHVIKIIIGVVIAIAVLIAGIVKYFYSNGGDS